jgi:hypothetical protein
MRELNITNDVIDFLKKSFNNKLSTAAIIKEMIAKGWNESCNDWEGFVALLDKRNLDRIFYEYEFYIRY